MKTKPPHRTFKCQIFLKRTTKVSMSEKHSKTNFKDKKKVSVVGVCETVTLSVCDFKKMLTIIFLKVNNKFKLL